VTASDVVCFVAAGAVFALIIPAARADQVRQARREGPKCPCGCGRTPGAHNEPLTPPQVRRLP
jgi:hypothetical protein